MVAKVIEFAGHEVEVLFKFPSPCGVMVAKDSKGETTAEKFAFPSPCGVMVAKAKGGEWVHELGMDCFRPLAG